MGGFRLPKHKEDVKENLKKNKEQFSVTATTGQTQSLARMRAQKGILRTKAAALHFFLNDVAVNQ